MMAWKSLLCMLMCLVLTNSLKIELQRTNHNDKLRADLKNMMDVYPVNKFSKQEVEDSYSKANGGSIGSDVRPDYRDIEYYGPLEIGSNHQKFNVTFDINTDWSWVCDAEAVLWGNCEPDYGLNTSTTTTFQKTDQWVNMLDVYGYISSDNTNLPTELQANMTFVLADFANIRMDEKITGVIGLSPNTTYNNQNFVDALYQGGVIDARQFEIYTAKTEAEKSYIKFGKYEGDLTNATSLKLVPFEDETEITRWTVDFERIGLDYHSIDNTETSAVVQFNMGTEKLGLPAAEYYDIIYGLGPTYHIYYCNDSVPCYLCDGPDDAYDIELRFDEGRKLVIDHSEYIEYHKGYCLLTFENLGAEDHINLGTHLFKGTRFIFDMDGQQVLIPQEDAQENASH